MLITFDTEAMTVEVEGVEPVEVADISEALQVIEAGASEMMSEEIEPDIEDGAMEEELPGAMASGEATMEEPVEDTEAMEEEAMMKGYK